MKLVGASGFLFLPEHYGRAIPQMALKSFS
jgi:hypothetical protein